MEHSRLEHSVAVEHSLLQLSVAVEHSRLVQYLPFYHLRSAPKQNCGDSLETLLGSLPITGGDQKLNESACSELSSSNFICSWRMRGVDSALKAESVRETGADIDASPRVRRRMLALSKTQCHA